MTQPLMYKAIKEHRPLFEIYAKQIGFENLAERAATIKGEFESAQKAALQVKKKPLLRELPGYWDNYFGGRYKAEYELPTGVAREELAELTERLTTYPEGFHIHPKVKKLLEQRAEMGAGKKPLDYGMAEALAFASLVKQGIPVRMSGQDTRRATFNQRHSVLIDIENESEYMPLRNIAAGQAPCEIYNSPLSEAGVMGFEYGYSRDYPEALVMWEAQFGDFANVAQAVIDQFVSAGEDKWGLLSGLVLLLPHGHEGQGPEHSSARIERFLQLAARDNFQICQPSNAGQYFHLLRRQALRTWRKPLVVFTPKSMLRHPDALSPLEDFTQQQFLAGDAGQGSSRRKADFDLHGKDWARTAHGAAEAQGHEHGDRVCGADVSVPGGGIGGGTGASQRRARDCLGAGRAGEHGSVVLHAAAAAAISGERAGAFGEAVGECESGDGFGEGARGGAEDAAGAGIYDSGVRHGARSEVRSQIAEVDHSLSLVLLNALPFPFLPIKRIRHVGAEHEFVAH